MAGRIRTIKPELLEDEATAGLSHVAFRLFVGMLLLADDHGNLRATPAWLQGQVFHAQTVTRRVFDAALVELGQKLVELYEIDGQSYAHVRGWTKHQRVDNAMAPRVPVPPGWECVEEKKAEGSRARNRWISRRIVGSGAAPSSTNAGHDTQRVEGGAAGSRSPITDPDPDVEREGAAPPPPNDAPPSSEIPEPETPKSEPPLRLLTPHASRVANELTKHGEDLFTKAPPKTLAGAATRIARAVEAEDRAGGEATPFVLEAVNHARAFLGDHPLASPERVLAEVEKKIGFILGDVRSRKRAAPEPPARTPGRGRY